MKEIFISDVFEKYQLTKEVVLYGGIGSLRKFRSILFFDLYDSTGTIQVITDIKNIANTLKNEQSVCVEGLVCENSKMHSLEITARSISIIGNVEKNLSPSPRSYFDIFDRSFVNLVQENRHLYIRNPKVMAALQARDMV